MTPESHPLDQGFLAFPFHITLAPKARLIQSYEKPIEPEDSGCVPARKRRGVVLEATLPTPTVSSGKSVTTPAFH